MHTPFTVTTTQPDLPAKPKAWWQRLIVGSLLACTLLVQTGQVLAQYQNFGQNNAQNNGQPNTGYVAPSISAPVSAPFSGYNPDGTLYMGGQRIGNPHQVLHDAQIPAFMTITANRYTYSADPTHGQGTLAQMELATTNGSTSSVLLNRLYLSPNNPYATTQPLGQVWPYPNYQTYQEVLANARTAGYLQTNANDGKTYAFKTLTAASAQAFTILINELPNTPQFRAAADPAGGGVGVRVEQNGDAAALANYYKTVQPYNYNWQPNYGSFTGSGNRSGQNGQLDPMYRGWVNSPGGAYSGFDGNLDGANGQQTNQQRFDAFLQQQQNEALANDKRVRSQTSANSLDLSSINPNTLYGQGYNLFDYGNASNPNLALENEYLRKLQNGEFEVGSAGYLEARRIAEERYRIAYATRLETNKPLQYSVSGAQNKANELKLADTNPNLLFGDGYDLFNYDPLTNPNGAAENALLTRLQSGQLTPGTPEYEQASQIAQQRYRNAYANSLAFNIAPKFTVAEAQRKANAIDLSQVNPNELFGQGFDLFQYNPALRPNGEAENVLLAKLQNGELTVGSPEYLEATQIAQERLRVAYSQSLVPPEPKEKSWWKEIVIVVIAAIAVYFTAGAASAWLAELAASSAATSASTAAAAAGASAAGQAAAAGAAYASTLTAAASSSTILGAAIAGGSAMAGSYAGAVIGTGLSTGSLSQGLRAGEIALTRGSIQTLATVIVLGGLGLTGLDDVLGSTGTSIVSNSIGSAAATNYLSGGSFGDALLDASLQNIVNVASAGAAKEIGTQFPNLDGTNLLNYAAHAGLGCASASATGGNCAAGAAGAAAGEAAAATGLLNFAAAGFGQTLTDGGTVFFGGLVGGTVASALGSNDNINANFATGQATAQNAVTNNYLTTRQLGERETALKACSQAANSAQCRSDVNVRYLDLYQNNQAAVEKECLVNQTSCQVQINIALSDRQALSVEASHLAQQYKDSADPVERAFIAGKLSDISRSIYAVNHTIEGGQRQAYAQGWTVTTSTQNNVSLNNQAWDGFAMLVGGLEGRVTVNQINAIVEKTPKIEVVRTASASNPAEVAVSYRVPSGYTIDEASGAVTGPRGGSYSPTGVIDGNGNQVYKSASGSYYTFDATNGAAPSPAPSTINGVTAGQTVNNSRMIHNQANVDAGLNFKSQGATSQENVTMTAQGCAVTCVADQVVTYKGRTSLQVPPGFSAFDLNGKPLSLIPLNAEGKAIIEIKTGGGQLTLNQSSIYPQVQNGNAIGVGENANRVSVLGAIPPTPVTVLRKN